MKRYYVVCIAVGAVLAAITIFYQSEPTKFYGIADTKETIINAANGVEIKKLYVVQGQVVKEGDTLVILDQPELCIRINEIENALSEARAQVKYTTSIQDGERERYIAEAKVKIDALKTQIRELEARYATNIALVKELRSVKKDPKLVDNIADSSNALLATINGLKEQLAAAQNALKVNEERYRRLERTEDPVQAQIRRYSRELELLYEQEKQLVKQAPIGGIIGMVKFKEGEKVSPFDTILTLHTPAPSYIKGYIHENVYSHVSVNDTVEVQSFADSKQKIYGVVVGVGSRIVEYPERLRKRQDIPVWGREVVIRIPEDNQFLLGEKVLISVDPKKKRFPKIINPVSGDVDAAEAPAAIYKTETDTIMNIVAGKELSTTPIEASGLCYVPETASFILISDETDGKKPDLYIMDKKGRVSRKVAVKGLPAINDMEGITADRRGVIYLLASQSFNRKGKLPTERKLLAGIRREGLNFTLDRSVILLDLLLEAAGEKESGEWGGFIRSAVMEKSIDLEGIAWWRDTLILGFKNPKLNNCAVMLAVSDPDMLFETRRLSAKQVSVWRKIILYDSTSGTFCGISDICVYGDMLIGLSTGVTSKSGVDEDVGMIWEYRPETGSLEILQRFTNLKPEGIAVDEDENNYYIVFDNGSKNQSQYMTIKVLHE